MGWDFFTPPFKKNTQEITSHPTLPSHLFVSKSYKPTKCPELNAKVGNLSLTYVPAFFFPTKSWDKAAVSALAGNLLAPASIWWLQFSPFLSSHQCDLLCCPTGQFFKSHNPASRDLETLCTKNSLLQNNTISFQAWHWAAPRYTAPTKSFLPFGKPSVQAVQTLFTISSVALFMAEILPV